MGPYDQRTFTPKKLNIAVICQARHEGQVEAFVAKFLDGMPDVKTGRRGRETARYGDGFLRRFQLERPNVQMFTTASPSISGYQEACRKGLEYAANVGIQWDLALVQIEEEFKSLPGDLKSLLWHESDAAEESCGSSELSAGNRATGSKGSGFRNEPDEPLPRTPNWVVGPGSLARSRRWLMSW